jgi:negative regulator of sigma E activity
MAGRRGGRAAAQAAPLALSAKVAARRGVYRARTWAAPRLERTGQALEQRVAPRVAAMMSATARRIEPATPKRRRWPLMVAGVVAAAGVSATAAYLISRRRSTVAPVFRPEQPTVAPAPEPQTAAETAASDVNRRVHAP